MQALNWDEYFMSIAYIASLRSKDPNTQVGACITNKNHRIISTGYNGMPNGIDDSKMPWDTPEKHLYVVHAELNALLHGRNDLEGCVLYTTLFPCNECAKAIIQSGIKEVIYLNDKYKDKYNFVASRFMLEQAGVNIRQLESDICVSLDLKLKKTWINN